MKNILFKDEIKHIVNEIGNEDWTFLYLDKKTDDYAYKYFAFLIPENNQENILNHANWDFDIDSGKPGIVRYSEKENQYFRYGNDLGYEPILVQMTYNNLYQTQFELSEEFRHYFNLAFDKKKNCYVQVDIFSEETEIVYFTQNEIKVKTRYLKQYISLKKMSLVVNFDLFHFYKSYLNEINLGEAGISTSKNRNFIYKDSETHLLVNFQDKDDYDFVYCNSRLLGKKIVKGLDNYKPKHWFEEVKSKKFVDFIVKVNDDNEETVCTCNPDKLGSFFEERNSYEHYFTPVFFEKTVLTKYFNDSRRFKVRDNDIIFMGVDIFPIDNNNPNYIVVYLGDLGRYLSFKDQCYWRGHNVPPDGSISKVKFNRDFLNIITSPESPDLIFKSRYKSFQVKWFEKLKYHLFLPLLEEDHHYFEILRIPLIDSPLEFETQVLAITKILIDSLNEKEIKQRTANRNDEKGSINILDVFLKEKGFDEIDNKINFLRNLQKLRSSGVAHRKGDTYKKDSEKHFDIENRSRIDIFKEILNQSIHFLDSLEEHFL